MDTKQWGAIFAFATALVAIGVPVALLYFPDKANEIDVLAAAATALIAALGTFVAAWTGVSVLRLRADEEQSERWHQEAMANNEVRKLEALAKMEDLEG